MTFENHYSPVYPRQVNYVVVDIRNPASEFWETILFRIAEIFNETYPYPNRNQNYDECLRQIFDIIVLDPVEVDLRLKLGPNINYLLAGDMIRKIEFMPEQLSAAFYNLGVGVYLALHEAGILRPDLTLIFERSIEGAIVVRVEQN